MQIDYVDEDHRRFSILFCWLFVLIAVVIALVEGPARENGVVYEDWRFRASLGIAFLVLVVIGPTYHRCTRLDSEHQYVEIADRLLWFIPIRKTKLSFATLSAVECDYITDSDNNTRLNAYLRIGDKRKGIATRLDESQFGNDERQLASFAEMIGVELVIQKMLTGTRNEPIGKSSV